MKFPLFRLAGAPARPLATLRTRLPSLGLTAVVLCLTLLALLLGAIIALGSIQMTITFSAMLLALPVLFMFSTRQLLPLLFVLTYLVQGAMVEFLHMRIGTWITSALAGLLLVRALLELLQLNRFKEGRPHADSRPATAVYFAGWIYLAFFMLSLSQGEATTLQRISALRFAIPMFGVLFALFWFRWPIQRLQMIWWLLLGMIVLQLPLVAYQHFVLATARDWDLVTGTFGHGLSAVLVLTTLAAMVYALARWQHGVSSHVLPALIVPTGLLILLLGEVKAIVFWLPLAIVIVLRRRVLRNVGTLIMYAVFALVFAVGTFSAYKAMYWGEKAVAGNTIEEKLERTGGYFFDVRQMNFRNGEVSRAASLYLWYTDPQPGVPERLIGYGPGASLTSAGTGKGVVAARYRTLSINSTAVTQLLWDVGILGCIAFLAFLGLGVAAGWRFMQSGRGNPQERAMVDTALTMLVLYGTTVIYNRSLLDEPTMQLLFFFCLGCIVQFWRFGSTAGRPAAHT
ncbi:hypothetical protein [Pseudoduganella violacea]|uniref:O-antigen ligase domain-containing protein n=1 Tax=Pseudoduganella violacea TaxID=1715466 RepID=A0A7W5BB05_9BURK|nr:hypothetical protein [Pseudoduganella violacea]MBB3119606.1 hypothetical protein [Pseudoduganella violacea]